MTIWHSDGVADEPDLKALIARLPKRDIAADLARAQQEAERLPPQVSTIPEPDFLPGCITRFRCPLDCGWYHDEATDQGPLGPLLLPADFTADDLSAALSSQAEVRGNNFRLRVEQAITAHFDAEHPGR